MAVKFLKMAIANLLRYSTRTGLTALGLALAISAVLFVNVVALSFETGTSDVYDFIRTLPNETADVWVTPPTGFKLDQRTGFFTTEQTLPQSTAQEIFEQNQGNGLMVLTAAFPGAGERSPILYGCSTCEGVTVSDEAAELLGIKAGDRLPGTSLTVDAIGGVSDYGANGMVQMPLAAAQQILNQPDQISWAMLRAMDSLALRQFFSNQANIRVSTDPTVTDSQKQAIAYFLEERLSRADMVGFNVKLAAIYFNQAGSSILGWLSRITLGLGFVLMLTAALLSIEERKREFGIFAAVGVSSDVFYLFFLESLLLFVGSTIAGLLLGSLLLQLLVPGLFDSAMVLKSAVLVLCYLPPMIILGSLVPAQKLLQKSPLELIRSAG